MKLFCATTNQGKLREFRLAVERFGGSAFEVEPVPGLAGMEPCEEHGATFEENAAEKAVYYSARAPGLVFADDSGLEVDALGGAPGVYSARFAGEGASDAGNNRLLLEKLKDHEDRAARFVCVAALAESGRLVKTFKGTVEGRILTELRGANGFGYDPLFYYPPFGCTFGEVEAGRKLLVSHRGQALKAMIEYLVSSVRP